MPIYSKYTLTTSIHGNRVYLVAVMYKTLKSLQKYTYNLRKAFIF